MNRQLGLFGRAADPLIGLTTRLPDPCKCGVYDVILEPGTGPHRAALRCIKCETFRGWLPREIGAFLCDLIREFGRPTAPIAIRRGNSATK